MSANNMIRKRGASEATEVDGKTSSASQPDVKRTKSSSDERKSSPFLQGSSYQMKLAMLTLCRAHLNGCKVYLALPVLNSLSPGVDNFLLKYEGPTPQRWRFRLVHVKHQLINEVGELSAADFLEPQGLLSLSAYYALQREMCTSKCPSWNNLDHLLVLVHSNVSLPRLTSNDICLTAIAERDPIFDAAETSGKTPLKRYRIEKVPYALRKQLHESPGATRLAVELVKCFLTNGKLTLSNDVFAKYHYALIVEKVVILGPAGGGKAVKLTPSFIARQFASIRVAVLHNAMMEAVAEQDPEGKLWPVAQLRTVGVSNSFGAFKVDTVTELPSEKGVGFSVSEFLQKLVVGVGMPSEMELTRMVETELGRIFTLINGSVVFERLRNWLLTQMPLKAGCRLTNVLGKELLDNVYQRLSDWNLLGAMSSQPLKLLGLDERYDCFEGGVQPLAAAINSSPLLLVSTSYTSLAFLKVCQVLKQRSENDYAALAIDRLLSLGTYALAAMKSRRSYCVVVEMTCLAEDETPKAVQVLRQLVQEAVAAGSGGKKKVVLIAESDEPVSGKVLLGKTHTVHQDEDVSFGDLHEQARALVLQSPVCFQKSMVRLGDLTGEGTDAHFPADVLDSLLRGETFTVGRPLLLDNLRDALKYYVPRKLQLYCRFERECLGDDKLLVIATGASAPLEALKLVAERQVCRFEDGGWEKAPSDVKVILFASAEAAETNFDLVCAKFPDRSLQWLNLDGVFCAQKKPASGVHESEKHKPLVKVIAGGVGMGKSISLSSLAIREKKGKPLHWVLTANLPEFQSRLSSECYFTDLTSVVEFLCLANGLTEDYEQRILEHSLTDVGQAVVFLDGFNEIDLQAQANVLQAIRLLKRAKLEAVWLATDTCQWSEMEADLVDYRYELLPLLPLDQQTFLTKYWSARLKDSGVAFDEGRLTTVVQNFQRQLEDEDHGELSQWMKNPLRVQMLADIYWPDLKLSFAGAATSDTLLLSATPPADLLGLCERYVEDKVLQGLAIRESLLTFQEERAKFMDIHGCLAVSCLFPDEARKHGFEELAAIKTKDVDEEVLGGMKILLKNAEGRWGFAHHLWAQYFVARHFSHTLTDGRGAEDRHEQTIGVLKEVYFTERFDPIRPFLDQILAQGNRLFEAIFREDGDAVQKIVKVNPDKLNARDELGRTALHLAALYSPDNAFLRLVSVIDEGKQKVDVSAVDYMGFAPLCYALVFVSRPPPNATIPRHNLPIVYLEQKASEDDLSNALSHVVRVVEWRQMNREQIIKALTSLSDNDKLAEVVDGLDCPRILQRNAYCFETVSYVLDMASELRRRDMLLAEDCKMLRNAVRNHTWAPFAWVAANLEGDVLRDVEDAILKLAELEARFVDFATKENLEKLLKVSRVLTCRVRKELWRKVDYGKVFRRAVAKEDVLLVAELLRLFDDEAKESLFVGTSCVHFFQALWKTPYRDGYFAWMLERVRPDSFRATVMSAVDYVTAFHTAFLAGDRGTLSCLACCTDAEKAEMQKSVSPGDCLKAFGHCLEIRDSALLQLLLRFVNSEEQQKVFSFLNVEVEGLFSFDLEPDMDGLWIAQICDDLNSYARGFYDWSIWAHLLYALLRLQIRTQQ